MGLSLREEMGVPTDKAGILEVMDGLGQRDGEGRPWRPQEGM